MQGQALFQEILFQFYILCLWVCPASWYFLPGPKAWGPLYQKALGWPKRPFCFFHKTQDTHFSFSPVTLLIWIFWVCQLSPMVGRWLFWIKVLVWSLSAPSGLPNHGAASSEKSPAWHFTTHSWHESQHLFHTLYKSFFFFAFQLHFYLSWNNKA